MNLSLPKEQKDEMYSKSLNNVVLPGVHGWAVRGLYLSFQATYTRLSAEARAKIPFKK